MPGPCFHDEARSAYTPEAKPWQPRSCGIESFMATTAEKAARWRSSLRRESRRLCKSTQGTTALRNTVQEKAVPRKTTQGGLRDGKLCERSQLVVVERQRAFYRERAPPRRSPPLSPPALTMVPIPSLWAEAYRYLVLYRRDLYLCLLYLYLSYSISRSPRSFIYISLRP